VKQPSGQNTTFQNREVPDVTAITFYRQVVLSLELFTLASLSKSPAGRFDRRCRERQIFLTEHSRRAAGEPFTRCRAWRPPASRPCREDGTAPAY
jgi:hypothetical protein